MCDSGVSKDWNDSFWVNEEFRDYISTDEEVDIVIFKRAATEEETETPYAARCKIKQKGGYTLHHVLGIVSYEKLDNDRIRLDLVTCIGKEGHTILKKK